MSNQRKTSRRKRLISCVLLTVGIGVAVSLFAVYIISEAARSMGDWLSYEGGCLGSEPYSRQVIEQMGRFRIPSSGRSLNAYSEAFQDCVVYVDFEMDADELNDFLSSTYISQPLTSNTGLIGFGNLPPSVRWTLDSNKEYLYGRGYNGSLEFQNLAIETIDPETYKVYLITSLL